MESLGSKKVGELIIFVVNLFHENLTDVIYLKRILWVTMFKSFRVLRISLPHLVTSLREKLMGNYRKHNNLRYFLAGNNYSTILKSVMNKHTYRKVQCKVGTSNVILPLHSGKSNNLLLLTRKENTYCLCIIFHKQFVL